LHSGLRQCQCRGASALLYITEAGRLHRTMGWYSRGVVQWPAEHSPLLWLCQLAQHCPLCACDAGEC
jgi:hypothetical protein